MKGMNRACDPANSDGLAKGTSVHLTHDSSQYYRARFVECFDNNCGSVRLDVDFRGNLRCPLALSLHYTEV